MRCYLDPWRSTPNAISAALSLLSWNVLVVQCVPHLNSASAMTSSVELDVELSEIMAPIFVVSNRYLRSAETTLTIKHAKQEGVVTC